MFRKIYALFAILLGLAAHSVYADRSEVLPCRENSGAAFSLRADLLFWSPQVSGLELGFGSSTISQTIDDDIQIFRSSEYDVDPNGKWSAGYRVAAGYHVTDSAWQIEAIWTDYRGKAHKSSRENSSFSNEGKYRVSLEQIDGIAAYKAALSSCITFKPFFGVRATRIKQSVYATLFTPITLSSSSALETKTLNDKQTYYGIGPLAGIQADWDVGGGFGFYASIASGFMYGRFDVDLDDSSVCTAPISKSIYSVTQQRLKSFDCNIDLALGLCWKHRFCQRMESALKFGFEHHDYFNQNRMGSGHADVSFNGCILSFELGL